MELNEKQIAALEAVGFKRWTKGSMDRLYINAETLGLELDYYKSGNISGATYRGETISHTRGGEMKSAKTYIDIATGELHGTNWTLEQDAQQLYDETMEALDAPETTETETIEEEDVTMYSIFTEIENLNRQHIDSLDEAREIAEAYGAQGHDWEIRDEETGETVDSHIRDNEEEAPANRDYERKARIVRDGKSRVFQSWHDNADVTMEAFLDGLRWLCDDPMTDGRLTRELGCIRKADSGYTPEQMAFLGDVQDNGRAGLYRLTRSYYRDGGLQGFYDEDGRLWAKGSDRASISRNDHV